MTKQMLPCFLVDNIRPTQGEPRKDGKKLAIINRGMERFAEVMKIGFIQYELASQKGLFQSTDARVKILFLVFFAIIISLKKTIVAEIVIGAFLLLLAVASRLNLARHCRRILFLGFVFGFLVAIPSALNFVSTGKVILPLLHLSRPHDFWIYHVPQSIGFTEEGLLGVGMLTLRVMNSVAASLLVISTTPFPEVIKALKVMRAPDALLMTVALSYKYIFIFAQTLHDMHLAKKSRLVGPESDSSTRRWMASRMAFMFRKSQHRCEEVFKAMRQRGFSGSLSLYGYRVITKRDWIMGSVLFCAGILLLLM